jgi:DNA polymerase-3 subunit gamma/tau
MVVTDRMVVTPDQNPVSIPLVPPTLLTPVAKSLPVGQLTDKDRRSRYMKTENLSTPSISGMLNGDHLDASAPEIPLLSSNSKLKVQSFESDELINAWKAFAETVDAAQLKSALSVREPMLNDNFSVTYSLDNEVQHQRITQDIKPKLLSHLHRVLNNDQVTVDFIVTENLEEIMNKPYTNQEKFNALASRYSALNTMKQRFGLDFD